MTIAERFLVGEEKKIKVTFEIGGDANDLVAVGDFKLKISVVEQQDFAGATTGSQIKYKSAAGTEQAFSETFEKPLSEFSTILNLDRDNRLTEFKVNFDLLLASEAVKLKLKFELLDVLGNRIQDIDVEWIKGPMVLSPITPFKAKKASFRLKSLKENIKDLSKIILQVQSVHANVSLLVGKDRKYEASLAELLPGTTELIKDKESDPIKIVIDDLNDEEAVFSILVVDADALSNNPPVTEQKVNHPEFEQKQDPETGQKEQDPEIKQELEEIDKTEEERQLEAQQLKELKQEKKVVGKKIKQVEETLENEEKELKTEVKEDLKKLNEEEKTDLKGKSKEEKEVIKKKYKKKKKQIVKEAAKKVGENLTRKKQYVGGFARAYGHNAFGIPLKEPKTKRHAKGHEHGHKASLIIGRIETAVGPTVIGIGLAAMVAGTGPTFGGISVIAIPIVAGGTVILAHGLYTANEAQNSIDSKKEKDKENKRKENDKNNKKRAQEEEDDISKNTREEEPHIPHQVFTEASIAS
ncbi:MAG: hypothetical protein BGO68_01115 [Candidatus Amoebophilus sp. 36-38]|nr:MAG: hypothetical protein BGO68_01115 [Candidatus Amoebophilus sp. 36-38]